MDLVVKGREQQLGGVLGEGPATACTREIAECSDNPTDTTGDDLPTRRRWMPPIEKTLRVCYMSK